MKWSEFKKMVDEAVDAAGGSDIDILYIDCDEVVGPKDITAGPLGLVVQN